MIQLTLDDAGRLAIPKRLRNKLRLAPGDKLQLDTSGEQITLRPLRVAPRLRKEHGIWVYRTGRSVTPGMVNKWIGEVRGERDRANSRQD